MSEAVNSTPLTLSPSHSLTLSHLSPSHSLTFSPSHFLKNGTFASLFTPGYHFFRPNLIFCETRSTHSHSI